MTEEGFSLSRLGEQPLEKVAAMLRALEERREAVESILNSLSTHVAVLDEQGQIVEVNDAWTRFARDNGDPGPLRVGVGVNYLDVCRRASEPHAGEAVAALHGIEDVLAGRRDFFELEYPCHSPTQRRWYLMRVEPRRGEHAGAIVLHTDITARRQAQLDLVQAERQAAMGRLAAQIAHEINNPLAGLRSAFELIAQAVPPDHPDAGFVALAREELERLSHIVGQTYAAYRPLRQVADRFALAPALREAVEPLQAKAHARGLSIRLELPDDAVPATLPREAFVQVVANLVGAAVNVAPPGSAVRLRARRTAERLIVSVGDAGPDIPLEAQERIFESLVSRRPSLDPQDPGLGLGLSIAKSLAGGMGGQIRFRTRPGRGTVFRLRIGLPPDSP